MAYKLIITSVAQQHLTDAFDWYENQRAGLGDEFFPRVDASLQSICRDPGAYAIAHQQYRRALVRKFPYAIFFEELAEAVIVHCVCHTSRDSRNWQKHLP